MIATWLQHFAIIPAKIIHCMPGGIKNQFRGLFIEYRILQINRILQRLGKFSVEGMLAIFCFTAHLNDCR